MRGGDRKVGGQERMRVPEYPADGKERGSAPAPKGTKSCLVVGG